MRTKNPSIDDPIFARYIAGSVDQLGEQTVARALQTTKGVVKEIIVMRQIPAGVYAYARTMGFVEMAHEDHGEA